MNAPPVIIHEHAPAAACTVRVVPGNMPAEMEEWVNRELGGLDLQRFPLPILVDVRYAGAVPPGNIGRVKPELKFDAAMLSVDRAYRPPPFDHVARCVEAWRSRREFNDPSGAMVVIHDYWSVTVDGWPPLVAGALRDILLHRVRVMVVHELEESTRVDGQITATGDGAAGARRSEHRRRCRIGWTSGVVDEGALMTIDPKTVEGRCNLRDMCEECETAFPHAERFVHLSSRVVLALPKALAALEDSERERAELRKRIENGMAAHSEDRAARDWLARDRDQWKQRAEVAEELVTHVTGVDGTIAFDGTPEPWSTTVEKHANTFAAQCNDSEPARRAGHRYEVRKQ